MQKIFVSIAAYRDPELLPTIKNLLETADEPTLLTLCIGWQHANEDEWDELDEYKNDNRFTILDIPYNQAKGVCWMRAQIQKHISDEEYYLQLDSHHRFTKGWDTILKDWINYFRCKGVNKPIISSYLPAYFPDNDPEGRVNEVWSLNVQRFLPQGVLFLEPHGKPDWKEYKEPFPARFLSAHMIFSPASFVKDVPYDEELYFHGEESSLAARAYTYGYDLFSPHIPIIWHEYKRSGKKKHWDDNMWEELDKKSFTRYRKLMGSEEGGCRECEILKLAETYFGKEREFSEYEKYAGIKFSTRQLHEETIKGNDPPIKSDYEMGLTNKQKYCLDVYKELLKETDYDSFAIALLDENGNDIYRKDADENEIYGLLNESEDDKFIHIWREFLSAKKPTYWRVWPHSKSKGWVDRIENVISYE